MTKFARFALIPIAVLQFLTPMLPMLGYGAPVGDRAVEQGIPPELPLGLFFSIWGVIFTAYAIYAVVANTKPQETSDRLALPLAIAGLGNVVWMVSAQMIGHPILDFVLLLPILAASWIAAYRLDREGGDSQLFRHKLSCVLTGLLAGWLSVAVSISVPDLVRELLGRAPTDYVWHSLWMALVPAGLLAWIFASRISRSLWYFAAAGWGLLGVFSSNWWRTETHGLAIATVIVTILILSRRLRYGASGSAVT